MAASPITSLSAAQYLKIVSKGAVYNNLSEDSAIWEMIKQKKAGPAEGRELRFSLRSGYGAAAAGFLPLTGGSYPAGQQSRITEGVTVYKDYGVTIELERTIIAKAVSDFSKYGDPLAEELRSKTIAMSRVLSLSAYGDGTGVVGQRGAVAETIVGGRIVVTTDTTSTALGFVGHFLQDDKVVPYTLAGVAQPPTVAAGTFAHYSVESTDRDNDTVTLSARSAAGTELTITASNLAATDVFYRLQQETNGSIQDLTAIGSTDYNTLSESWTGLESLSANDGRTVNGIIMSGSLGGTHRDLGGAPIDSQDFQQVMSRLMINVGPGRYKYSKPLMAWETLDALVEARETDRRFQSIKDDKRGVSQLGYVHGKNTLIFTPDEFCPKQRVYLMPEGDVCQFHGGDFEFVNPDGSGQKFMLKPNGSGHDRTVRAYMEGSGALMGVHGSSIGVLKNFTV